MTVGDPTDPGAATSVARTVVGVLARSATLTGLIAAAGRVITGPLNGFDAEDSVNRRLARARTPAHDRWTGVVSTATDTVPTIATAVVLGAVLRARTGSWRIAVAPLAAITLETAVFMSAAALVGRARPDVPWLDRPAPTTSFPSGHTGAATALHATLAVVLPGRSAGLGRVLRVAVPPAVAFSRVYRGMHHPSDVIVGAGLGLWSSATVCRALGLGDQVRG